MTLSSLPSFSTSLSAYLSNNFKEENLTIFTNKSFDQNSVVGIFMCNLNFVIVENSWSLLNEKFYKEY